MTKRDLGLAIFLLVGLFILPASFAQDGCCINPADSSYVCIDTTESDCASAGSGYQYYSGTACEDINSCEDSCLFCRFQTTATTAFEWGKPALGCIDHGTGWNFEQVEPSFTDEPSCNGATPATPQSFQDISGTIRKAGSPVDRARVECIGNFTYSNPSGAYTLSRCSKQTDEIEARKGSDSGSYTLTTTDKNTLNTANLPNVNIDLSPATTATLTVTVNTPAAVKVDGISGYTETKSGTTTTFVAPKGTVTVTASAAGYQPQSSSFDLTSSQSISFTLVVIQTVVLRGLVLDSSSGIPPTETIAGATVRVYTGTQAIGTPAAEGTTTGAGFYTLNVPKNEVLTVQASADGFNADTKPLPALTANKAFNFTLSPTTIVVPIATTFNVTAIEAGTTNQLADVFIELYAQDGTKLTATTKVQGGKTFATFYNLKYGKYTVIAHHIDYEQNTVEFDITSSSSQTVPLTKIKTMTVSGKVVDSQTSAAIGGAVIKVADGTSIKTTQTAADGTFSILRKVSISSTPLFVSAVNYKSDSRTIPGNVEPTYGVGTIPLVPSLCNNPADLGKIELSKPAQDKGSVKLGWTADCAPTNFKILRKVKTATTFQTINLIASNALAYEDKAINEETGYCYRIEGSYYFGGPVGTDGFITLTSTEQCVDVGPAACFNGPYEFCDFDERRGCSEDLKTIVTREVCEFPTTCIQRSNQLTECLPAKQCDLCNRPFGVFSNPASQLNAIFGGRYSFNDNIFICSNNAVACFLESSRTVVDKYVSCEGVESCYDYTSQAACGEQKCNPSLKCEWQESNYQELGVGVCRPSEPEEQDCREFENAINRPGGLRGQLSNRVFAPSIGEVAKETCALYGDACYYLSSTGQCKNRNEVSCYDYANNQIDCSGEEDKNIDVVVTWSPTAALDPTRIKSAGTHEITQESEDVLQIGRCKFIDASAECVKDSDDNQGEVFSNFVPNKGKDCLNSANPDCALDITSPITTVEHGDFVKTINFKYTALDNISKGASLKTWFLPVKNTLLSDPLTTTYPVISAQNDLMEYKGSISNKDGEWTLFYYSEDAAHNLETIKQSVFTLDTKAPIITFTRSVTPDASGANKVMFTANLKLTGNDNFAYCLKKDDKGNTVAGLFEGTTPRTFNQSTLGDDLRNEWSEVYTNIGTGDNGIAVVYKWTCYDQAGNAVSGSLPFDLDANGIIRDPTRVTVKNRNDVDIEIKTEYDGNCSFIDDKEKTKAESLWTKFTATETLGDNEYRHTAKITLQNTEQNKKIKVGCRLRKVQGFVKGTNADDIKITIDDRAPDTKPFIISSGGAEKIITFKQPQWVSGSTFWLKCIDQVQDGEYPPQSDCGSVFFCTDTAATACTPLDSSLEKVNPEITQPTTLRYYSVDKLGNVQPIQSQIIKFDNTAPSLTLTPPLQDTDYLVTKDSAVVLRGTIFNSGTGDISPIDVVYYEVRDDEQNIISNRNGTLAIAVSEKSKSEIKIPEKTVLLKPNSNNFLYVSVKDEAGNTGSITPIKIVQDSAGPQIANATLNGIEVKSFTSPDNRIEFGSDFDVDITDLVDDYAEQLTQGDLRKRVDSVWVEDMFGTVYQLKPDDIQKLRWQATIKTSSWLVTSDKFKTYITIFANDSLGNIAEKRVDLIVADNIPPSANFWLENAYGTRINHLIKGLNYVVLQASEPLRSISMYVDVPLNGISARHPVIFIARDFDNITWTGFVNVSSDAVGTATVGGMLFDTNGLNSSDFNPLGIGVQAYDLIQPLPNANLINGVYYSQTRNPGYVCPAGYDCLFTLNGEYVNPAQLLLNLGANDVTVRIEDADGSFKTFTQKIFFNATVPTLVPGAPVVITLITKPISTGKPLYAEIGIAGGVPIASPILTLDGTTKSLTRINDGWYTFKETIAEGSHQLVAKATDQNNVESTQEATVIVDATLSSLLGSFKFTNIQNISGVLTSRNHTIMLNGSVADVDVSVYIIGRDGDKYDAVFNPVSKEFSISNIRLVGRTFTETSNELLVVVRDAAGNTVSKVVTVVKDLQPPELIRLLFTRIFG
jgi:hypothetical protein